MKKKMQVPYNFLNHPVFHIDYFCIAQNLYYSWGEIDIYDFGSHFHQHCVNIKSKSVHDKIIVDTKLSNVMSLELQCLLIICITV